MAKQEPTREEWEEAKETLERVKGDVESLKQFVIRHGSPHLWERLKGYGMASVLRGLSDDHDYIGDCPCTVEGAISELEPYEEGE